MTTKVCDTCRKEVAKLNELVDDYKVDRISEVCDQCLKEFNEVLDKVRTAQLIQRENFMRRFIKSIYEKHI